MDELKEKIRTRYIGNRTLKDVLVAMLDTSSPAESALGADLTSAGGAIELTEDMTLNEALQAIIDAVDPA